MNLTKLAASTIIALTFTMSASVALAQDKGNTVDNNLDQAGQNMDNAGENLKDAGSSFGNSVENTGEAAGTEVKETANAIEQRSNWGWLGLIGLLGLFGLAGKHKETRVAKNRDGLEPLNQNDPTTTYNR
jgi:hypothetical protein